MSRQQDNWAWALVMKFDSSKDPVSCESLFDLSKTESRSLVVGKALNCHEFIVKSLEKLQLAGAFECDAKRPCLQGILSAINGLKRHWTAIIIAFFNCPWNTFLRWNSGWELKERKRGGRQNLKDSVHKICFNIICRLFRTKLLHLIWLKKQIQSRLASETLAAEYR